VGHRLEALTFYVGEMVKDLGGVVILLALAGLWWVLRSRAREGGVLALFSLLYLWSVSPSRWLAAHYALGLYAVVCIMAGAGAEAASRLVEALFRAPRLQQAPSAAKGRLRGEDVRFTANLAVVIAFLILTAREISGQVASSRSFAAFKPSQVEVAEYLERLVGPEDRVGVLDFIPLAEIDLWRRDIDFEDFDVNVSVTELMEKGVTYVIGTDRVGGDFPSTDTTFWDSTEWPEGVLLAEFGEESLLYTGYPVARIYLYVAEVEALTLRSPFPPAPRWTRCVMR
jgi:hypothetical protein